MTTQRIHASGKPLLTLPAVVTPHVSVLNSGGTTAKQVHQPVIPNRFKVATNAMTRSKTVIIDNQNIEPVEPTVYFTQTAMAKMKYIIDKSPLEVGWMALVKNPAKGVYLIHEVFLPTQEVTAVETDFNGAAMGELAEEVLNAGHCTSEMYAWFHSHVNMGVSPSAQDERQVEELLEGCEVFIRGIMNKRGDIKVDVYYRDHNIAYTSVKTEVIIPNLDEATQASLDTLLADRVSQRVYQTAYQRPYYNQAGHHNPVNPHYTPERWANHGKDKEDLINEDRVYDSEKKNHRAGLRSGLNDAGFDSLWPDDEDQDLQYEALTPLASDAPILTLNGGVTTGYGIEWDETTPIHLRPSGWSMDEWYLEEGLSYDMFR